MIKEYDLFEKMPDGSLIWRDFVEGREKARLKLTRLSAFSPNEFRAIHIQTNKVVARVKHSEA